MTDTTTTDTTPQGEAGRFILVSLTLPDGSNGTPDPEEVTEDFRATIADHLGNNADGDLDHYEEHRLSFLFDVQEVYCGDVVGTDQHIPVEQLDENHPITAGALIEGIGKIIEDFEAAALRLRGDRTENESCSDEVDDGIADGYCDVTARLRALITGAAQPETDDVQAHIDAIVAAADRLTDPQMLALSAAFAETAGEDDSDVCADCGAPVELADPDDPTSHIHAEGQPDDGHSAWVDARTGDEPAADGWGGWAEPAVDEDDLTPDTDPDNPGARSLVKALSEDRARALALPVLEDDSTGHPLATMKCDNIDAHDELTAHRFAPEHALVLVKRDTETREVGQDDAVSIEAGTLGMVFGHMDDCHDAHVHLLDGRDVWIDPQLLHVEPVTAVEFTPCAVTENERDGDSVGPVDAAEAEFWTVYARGEDDLALALVDVLDRAAAEKLAEGMGAVYGVDVEDTAANMEAFAAANP